MKNKGIIIFTIILVIGLGLIVYLLLDHEKSSTVSSEISGIYDASDLFTKRDLRQTADTSSAVRYTVKNHEDIKINTEGVYVISGTSSETTIYVEADDEDKVQIVLDGVNITNTDFPCIYVKTGDKVFITTISDSSLSVTGTFTQDGNTKTNGVVFSRSDIIFNGTATLTIDSTDNGIVSKDDAKVTGGTYYITATANGMKANDSIAIADGTISIISGTDGLHAENNDDDTLGYIYIGGGSIDITCEDDGLHGVSVIQIDEGTIDIKAGEGIEGTYIQINGGNISIEAAYDGINAANKSNSYTAKFEMNQGTLTIVAIDETADAIDSNGDIEINHGVIDITASLPFDYLGEAKFNGGTLIINGVEVSEIPASSK